MITVVAGILMLGILVFIHEFGHFCIAKLAGVKVLKFSLGFGPRLVSRTWGETEYMICAVPLGGYVQMLGEGGGENGEGAELTAEEKLRSFSDKPVSRRMAIVAAGPLMNLILPFLLLPLAYLVGVTLPAYLDEPPCIGYVAEGSVGSGSGFSAGDCILALGDGEVSSWSETERAIVSRAGSPLEFTVLRGAEEVSLTIESEDGGMEGLQSFGLLPPQEARVGSMAQGKPALAAGMEIGDLILAVDGRPVGSWYELKPAIQVGGGKPQSLSIERDGELLSLTLTPVAEAGGDYLIGIGPLQRTVVKNFGLSEAVVAGGRKAAELIELTLVFIQKAIAGHVSSKSIGGPITVVQVAGQAAQTGLASILGILAFLSIQLGILNLLPIPILDGGHLFFYFFELVFRRPLSMRAREVAQQIGLVLLVLLMLLAFWNDFVRLFLGGQ